MTVLSVQLQPARSPALNVATTVARLRGLAEAVSVSEGEEGGGYVNVSLRAADVVGLWGSVRELLQADAALARAAIVVCQGERGWDDYLLLHHFDPSQVLDELV
jgi:hypothetical protein